MRRYRLLMWIDHMASPAPRLARSKLRRKPVSLPRRLLVYHARPMPYMLLIHEPVGQRQTRTQAEGEAVYERMLRFAAELQSRGVLRAVESLASQDGAARVKVSNGRAHVLDGPFAEAKEMVGGFFLLDVDSRDEAVAIARECPAAEWATVEVRATGPCYT